ncbi:MAG: isoprenylcysteine carboxylmethyltransferase family protein [Ruminococcus sp.]|uniref:methyltransferase family protein n=1 Tax=Ruminococcus sp. TaxID=41978 RepID=UPI0025EAD2AE|nr:isoprenylcysteine carboxylmethyltransferase family protein [Ruminococcus sp.]MCR4796136.1 isoprenylcysteine carboxylmethyltransferase family protein [Ruminococcus sp.]
MKKKLIINGLIKLISGFIILMLLIFLPAGTLRFLNGWLFIGLLFIPMLIMGIVLLIKNPALLEKRLNGKEKESEQKGVVALSGIMFLAGFVVAGLNYRFDWWTLPDWCVIAASVVFLLSYVMYAEVLRENTYLSRTIEVQENQKVIDTGLYSIVRHPMYSATILMFLAIPLILGSLIALFIFLAYPLAIALRISNEEEVLEKGLAGYSEYKKKVKYRIIPFIW